AFPWLFENLIDSKVTPQKMTVLRKVGVPYTDQDIANASAFVEGKREIDALVAYLQGLGTSLQAKR
ncbi:MAG: cytochrome-c oxidase, cbb3-type subunit II, partial [Alphaproteobacteria bacterium]|nr:cytochrome-c oxidase, cbb3-type subunit II [Alphaproteobacteria bacterium]